MRGREAILLAALCCACLVSLPARAQVGPPPGPASRAAALADADRIALTEAMRLARLVGDSLWPDWGEAPLAVLLITPETEFLIDHPRASSDFRAAGDDPTLGAIRRRARIFPPDLLASFPAVGGFPTIVVGRPEATRKSPTGWALTIMHERFHQLQMSQPNYFPGLDSLGLARGDTTGQWMLDYPFPYEDPNVRGKFVEMTSRLLRALETAGSDQFAERAEAYHAARERFRESLTPEDYRYAQFQLWQEGVARFIELQAAELAARSGEPPAEFRALPGYEPYADVAARLRTEIMEGLQTAMLSDQRRIAFYPLGAGMALLLDLVSPRWRDRYLTEPFALDPYFEAQ